MHEFSPSFSPPHSPRYSPSPPVVSSAALEQNVGEKAVDKDLLENVVERPSKAKRSRVDKPKESTVDVLLAKSLMDDINKSKEPEAKTEIPEEAFCRSLVPHIEVLPERIKILAKIRIMEALYLVTEDE